MQSEHSRSLAQSGKRCRILRIALRGARRLSLALTISGCSDNGPSTDDPDLFLGRWLLETVNDIPLPTTANAIAQGFPDPDIVRSARLEIRAAGDGFPIWEFCAEDAEDGHLFTGGHDEVRYAPTDDADRAELSLVNPLNVQVDTLRLQGGVLTWEYRGGGPLDLLRFRRLEDGEAEDPICALAESRR